MYFSSPVVRVMDIFYRCKFNFSQQIFYRIRTVTAFQSVETGNVLSHHLTSLAAGVRYDIKVTKNCTAA